MSTKWDIRFLQLANLVSTWSRDPSTKVGAVIVDDKNRVLSLGFNGFPRGIEDSPERLEDREKKYGLVLHAEQNAILCASGVIEGASCYIYPLLCCNRCALEIIQSGIKRVISIDTSKDEKYDRWKDAIKLAHEVLKEANVAVVLY